MTDTKTAMSEPNANYQISLVNEIALIEVEVRKLKAKLTRYEAVMKAARQIFDVVKFPRDNVCPHGNTAHYPGHAWYCDGCWQQLEEALEEAYEQIQEMGL